MADEWWVAQDTFCAELPGGGQVTVAKGSTWHRSEHVVSLDAGRNVLFLPQRSGPAEDPAPKRSRRGGKGAAAGADDMAPASGETEPSGAESSGADDVPVPAGAWSAPDDDGGA